MMFKEIFAADIVPVNAHTCVCRVSKTIFFNLLSGLMKSSISGNTCMKKINKAC